MGYRAHRTRGSADGGVDIIAEKNGAKIVIQCKNYKAAVGPAPVRDLFGVVMSEGASRGILVCTSTFSESAMAFAEGKPIELIDGEELATLINKHGIEPLS
jgi:restriction system protein